MRKQGQQQRELVLSKLREVQRLVTLIHGLDEQDPERSLAVLRWMIEAEETTRLAATVKHALSAQELTDLEAATTAITEQETQPWEKQRIQLEIMRLWTENEER